MRRTLIPHLKSLWKTSKIKIEMKIEMEKYIFLSVAADCNAEMQIEMRLWFPRSGPGFKPPSFFLSPKPELLHFGHFGFFGPFGAYDNL